MDDQCRLGLVRFQSFPEVAVRPVAALEVFVVGGVDPVIRQVVLLSEESQHVIALLPGLR